MALQSVDYTDTIKIERSGKQRTAYMVTCLCCGSERYMVKSSINVNRVCARCQRSAAGKLGFKAMLNSPKRELGLAKFIEYLETHKSKPEQKMQSVLEEMFGKEAVSSNMLFDPNAQNVFVVDFYVAKHNLAVEVNGRYVHSSEAAKARDARKAQLLKQWGFNLVVVWDDEMNAAKDLVEAAVA